MADELERVRLLLGEENLEKLQKACVLVAGVGGVGSYAAEAFARSGVGKLILIDKDKVALSNLNRQIMAEYGTVGENKTEVMKERIGRYCHCEVVCVNEFLSEENVDLVEGCDFAVDAIDTVSSKIAFYEACHKHGVPFISSLGMGNRLDPTKIEITELMKTSGDPLAKAVRTMARKKDLRFKVPVLISTELPMKQNTVVDPDGATRKEQIPPASMIFVPASAGLAAASYGVRTIIAKEKG